MVSLNKISPKACLLGSQLKFLCIYLQTNMGRFDPLYAFMHSKGNFVGQLDQERRCRRCTFFILSNHFTAKQIIYYHIICEIVRCTLFLGAIIIYIFSISYFSRSFAISDSRISAVRQILLPDDFTMPFKQVPDYRLLGNLHVIMPLVLYRERAWL